MYSPFNRAPKLEEVTVNEVASRLAHDPSPPYVLDVREPDEWDEAHIEQATLIPLGELGSRLAELPAGAEIVCVCRSGQRSAMAAQALAQAGYQVKNMKGGMLEWLRQRHPVVSE